MGFLEAFFLGGGGKSAAASAVAAEPAPDPIPHLSSLASFITHRCCRVLGLSTEQLLQHFQGSQPDHPDQALVYARSVLEYCSFKLLREETKRPDYLSDKEFHLLMFDMMLAWEAPDAESESVLKERANSFLLDVEDDDDGSIFYESATKMAIKVDGKKTVGLDAFSRIAPACAAVADPITVHNLFDTLTISSEGRLHFLIYNKYLKCLDRVLRSAKCISSPHNASSLQLSDGEIVLDVDGLIPTKPVLQHIGTSTWPGRLTLTSHALYFESSGIGFLYNKADVYDLAKDLKQVIKRDSTGPWGAHLFDKAVMYKSKSLAEPIFLEFPQFKGHSRRDYWFAIIREILNVHKFIRKFNLRNFQKAEALSEATLGIFRYRAVKEGFHILPSHFKTTLSFNLAEKLPKGDKILDALYSHLELFCVRSQGNEGVDEFLDEKPHTGPFPLSVYTLSRMGFLMLDEEHSPEERDVTVDDVRNGGENPLQMAVKASVCYSGRAEAARATLYQVKVEDIDTNVTVMKELLFPLMETGKALRFLADWEDPFRSHVFLVLFLYIVYRGWISYFLPSIFFGCAIFMLWYKHYSNGKPTEAFQITPPSKSTVEQLLTLQEVVSKLETHIQDGTIFLLKLRAIMFAAFPQTTKKVAIALLAVAMAFALMPLKNIVLLVVLEAYTRQMPLRKESSQKLVRRIREWWARVPAAPVQLVRL